MHFLVGRGHWPSDMITCICHESRFNSITNGATVFNDTKMKWFNFLFAVILIRACWTADGRFQESLPWSRKKARSLDIYKIILIWICSTSKFRISFICFVKTRNVISFSRAHKCIIFVAFFRCRLVFYVFQCPNLR